MLPTVSMYFCKTCGLSAPYDQWSHDDIAGIFCAGCDGTPEYTQDVTAQFVSLALYELDRAYGGPEEGGWYYTTGTILPETLRNFDVADWPQAKLYADQLRDRAEELEADTGISYMVEMKLDITAPAFFPPVRPRYC